MKKSEKVFLILLAFVVGLVLLDILDNKWLSRLLWLLALVYTLGGYWLLRSQNQPKAIPILSGVAIGAALFMLPWGIVANGDWQKMLLFSIPNLCLCLFLLLYAFLLKHKNWFGSSLKPMLVRSVAIVVLSGIFVSVPLYTWAHRRLLWALNQQNEYLLHNLRMFDYTTKGEEYLSNNMCDAAIEACSKARKEGELWLGWHKGDPLHKLYNISGAIKMQYRAYLCKGEAAYNAEEYKDALTVYRAADAVLDDLIGADSTWSLSKVGSLDAMADCHAKLFEFGEADSLYLLAIKHHIKTSGAYNEDLADLLVDMSINYTMHGVIHESNKLIEQIVPAFEQQRQEEGDGQGLMVLYQHLIANFMRADSAEKAEQYLQKGFEIAEKGSLDYYKLQHYNGYLKLYNYKFEEAIRHFEEANKGYVELEADDHSNHVVIRQSLFKAHLALGDYQKAEAYIQDALALSEKIHGADALSYHGTLMDVALLEYRLGEYTSAQKKLQSILLRYEKQWGVDTNQLPEVLTLLAQIEGELDNLKMADKYVTRAFSIAKQFPESSLINKKNLWLNIANIHIDLQHYPLADSLLIDVQGRTSEKSKITKAEALAGLAVINMELGRYSEASKMLEQSLDIVQERFNEAHPMLATLYYNKSRLLLMQGQYAKALQEAGKAVNLTQQYLPAGHPDHGDNYLLLGDIILSSKRASQARTYYRKAEEIYKSKFKADHIKRKLIRERLHQADATEHYKI